MGLFEDAKRWTAEMRAAGAFKKSSGRRKKVGPGTVRVPLAMREPCHHEGNVIEHCYGCKGALRSTRECDRFGDLATRIHVSNKARSCDLCSQYTAPERVGDAKCGIVVGVYKWAALAEVQIRAVRESCGPVPVLISNDDPRIHADLKRICAKYPGAELSTNPERIGHGGGDIAAFHKGATWGRERGFEYVCKLSQRFIPTGAYWLQDGAKALALADLATAARTCDNPRWPIRTEIVLMRVRDWAEPGALEFYRPRPFYFERENGYDAEMLIAELIREHLGGAYWPWELVPVAREQPGPFLWHHSSTPDQYRALANRYGVTLPDDFTCAGWEEDYAKGLYKHG